MQSASVRVNPLSGRVSEISQGDICGLQEKTLQHRRSILVRSSMCIGCNICKDLCPREAITVTQSSVSKGHIKDRPRIKISSSSCNFCGICAVVCPTKAIMCELDGEKVSSLVKNNALPQLSGMIVVKKDLCEGCEGECKASCHTHAIDLKKIDSKRYEPIIDEDLCIYCSSCEITCPKKAISVDRKGRGHITFTPDKCEKDCELCVEICLSGSLKSKGKKVLLDDRSCIYCGACQQICPAGAIEAKLTSVPHPRTRSATWWMVLARLTSFQSIHRELVKSKYQTMTTLVNKAKRFTKQH